jgi:hypothetical protein
MSMEQELKQDLSNALELAAHQRTTLTKVAELVERYVQAKLYMPPIIVRNQQVQSFLARIYTHDGAIVVDVVSRSATEAHEDLVSIPPGGGHMFEQSEGGR